MTLGIGVWWEISHVDAAANNKDDFILLRTQVLIHCLVGSLDGLEMIVLRNQVAEKEEKENRKMRRKRRRMWRQKELEPNWNNFATRSVFLGL